MTDRKRPSQRRSAELVSSIVTATSAVIGQFGFEKATIEKIANKAGVSVGSIYQYFSSRESILSSFVTNGLTTNRDMMMERLHAWRELPLRETITRLVSEMSEHWENNSNTARHVYFHSSALGLRGTHMRMRREVIAAVTDLFEHHRDELRVENCALAAVMLIHASTAVVTAKFIDPELPFSIAELKDELITMVERYLLTTPHGSQTPPR